MGFVPVTFIVARAGNLVYVHYWFNAMKGYAMLLLIGGVGQVGPRFKRQHTTPFIKVYRNPAKQLFSVLLVLPARDQKLWFSKRRHTLGNDSTKQRKSCHIQFLLKNRNQTRMGINHLQLERNIDKSQNLCFISYISLNNLSNLFIKNTI